MNQLDQTIEALKFCVETLGMNDEEDKHIINAYDKLYFALATQK